MAIADLSLNSTSRIRLSNLLGFSEASAPKAVETIEFVELPKPDIHIVTIIAILISCVLICVIIVISLKRFAGGSLSEADKNFAESFDNPALDPSNEDGEVGEGGGVDVGASGSGSGGGGIGGRGGNDEEDGEVAETSNGMIRMALKTAVDRSSIKSEDSGGEPAREVAVRKSAANRHDFFKRKPAHVSDSKLFQNVSLDELNEFG